MENISDFISGRIDKKEYNIDSHIHVIGSDGFIPRTADVMVCALFDIPESPRESNYSEFTGKLRDKGKDFVIGIGANESEMIRMLQDSRFDGYGEFICNKTCEEGGNGGERFHVHDTSMANTVVNTTRKPVYIHYDLCENNWKEFEMLVDVSRGNVVLCHCGLGIPKYCDNDLSWKRFKYLMNKYDNLYGDVSWYTLKYVDDGISSDKLFLNGIPMDRIVFGTDITDRTPDQFVRQRLYLYNKLRSLVDNTGNINRLFSK